MSGDVTIRNAVIQSTQLGTEDHVILTAYLQLDYGGSGQSFGGWSFDEPVKSGGVFLGRRGGAYGMEFIRQLLAVVGVERWEQLPGKSVRVKASSSRVEAIGHYLREEWLDPKQLFDAMKAAP